MNLAALAFACAEACNPDLSPEFNGARILRVLEAAHSPMTEADVVAFLTARAAELAERTGIAYSRVSIGVLNACHGGPAIPEFATYVNGGTSSHGTSLAEAIDKQVQAMAPATLAACKREAARKLMAEADALTQKLPTAEAGSGNKTIEAETEFDPPEPTFGGIHS